MNSSESQAPCLLLGILDDGWGGLGERARAYLLAADLVIGAARTLELVRDKLPPAAQLRAMDGQLGQVPSWISAARAAGQRVVALATGDPLCHGIASWLTGKLGPEACLIEPAASTLQLAFARFKTPWQDVRIATCHSADAGEWFLGAPPTHGLYKLMRSIAHAPRVALFTGPENTPARLARALLTAGYGATARLSVACCLLLPEEKIYTGLALETAARMDFPQPNVVLVERENAPRHPLFGLEDAEYIQRSPEKGLITKQEVRALSLAKLRLRPDSVVWDIGAGAGSVGLEAAQLASFGHVWAIEKNAGDAANARANAVRLQIGNYSLVEGKAPQHLHEWPDPDAVFIGGSGGELTQLIALALQRLRTDGRLVMNFVTLENLATATATLQQLGVPWDVVQLQASRSQPLLDMHRLAAQNPVWVLTAHKTTSATPPQHEENT